MPDTSFNQRAPPTYISYVTTVPETASLITTKGDNQQLDLQRFCLISVTREHHSSKLAKNVGIKIA